jgi:hypothetical protein
MDRKTKRPGGGSGRVARCASVLQKTAYIIPPFPRQFTCCTCGIPSKGNLGRKCAAYIRAAKYLKLATLALQEAAPYE